MKAIRVTLLVYLTLALAAAAFAQSQAGLGSISGVVQDASGAVVPGAKVVVSNPSKGITRSLETNAEGYFAAPSLPPGPGYQVTSSATGFSNYERRDMELFVGQQLNLTVTMAVEGAQQTVEVSAGAPLVETAKQGVSQVVTTKQIDDLPINGRRVDSFVLLTPGVTNDGTFGLVSFRGIPGGNTFLTDGNDTTNSFYNENAGRTRISSQISQDAVQEFQVLSNGFSAEFGHAVGGVVNTVTRSGTNDIHGTAYWFYRNQDFSARDRYATINPQETRHQAGFSIGGPVLKDKLFYFFNYEPTRRDFPAINRLINSSLTDTAGVFNAPCSKNSQGLQPTAAQCTAAANYMMRGNNQLVDRTVTSDLLFGKIDYHLNERNTISASLNYLRWISPNGIQTQAVLTNNNAWSNNANSTVNTRYGRLSWTAIPSNTIVNEARFGWFKDRLYDYPNDAFFPNETGKLYVTVAGAIVGAERDYPRLNPSEQRFQFADTLSWNVGKHQFKFGGDIMSTQDYLNILRNQFGSYSYNSFQDFALDFTNAGAFANAGKHYSNFTQTFGNPILDFTTKDYDFFVQDQFRVTPKLTVNLGVRYEYTQIQQPTTVNPNYPQTGRINQPANNWAPRAGISYALGDKTVLRGGFGMFYARYPGALLQTLYFNNGVYQPQVFLTPTTAGAPTFPNILGSNQGLPAGSVNLGFASPDFRNPYTLQGDFAVERQLTQNIGLTLSYIYSHGVQFFTARDLNIGKQGPVVSYRINDASGKQVGTYATATYLSANKVDKRYSRIVQVANGAQTWYNALAIQVNKRFSHGLVGSVAYTWSHAIDQGNIGAGSDFLFFDTLRTYYNGDYRNDKGSSSLDQRHRLVVNSVWSPTFTTRKDWVARFLVNGWQLSQITTLGTPQYATATLRVNGTPYAGAAFTSTLNGFGGITRVPWLPYNTLEVDSFHRVDARLTRELPFTERFRLFLNFEAFNVFNTISNTAVLTEAYSLRNGVISPTAGVGAGTQSQGFPDGTNARRTQVSARFVF